MFGCLENEHLRPKTQKRRPLENEDLENEDPLENIQVFLLCQFGH